MIPLLENFECAAMGDQILWTIFCRLKMNCT